MYTKLFGSLVTSSVWSEDDATRILWITMLASADAEGYVFGSAVGLAAVARLPLPAVIESLNKLLGPDSYSSDLKTNPDNKGKRLEETAGGWRIVNYTHYRDLARAEDRRNQQRLKKSRQREAKRLSAVPHLSLRVPDCPHSDSDTDTRSSSLARGGKGEEGSGEPQGKAGSAPQSAGSSSSAVPGGLSQQSENLRNPGYLSQPDRPMEFVVKEFFAEKNLSGDPEKFWLYWESKGWRDKNDQPIRSWQAKARSWSKYEHKGNPFSSTPSNRLRTHAHDEQYRRVMEEARNRSMKAQKPEEEYD